MNTWYNFPVTQPESGRFLFLSNSVDVSSTVKDCWAKRPLSFRPAGCVTTSAHDDKGRFALWPTRVESAAELSDTRMVVVYRARWKLTASGNRKTLKKFGQSIATGGGKTLKKFGRTRLGNDEETRPDTGRDSSNGDRKIPKNARRKTIAAVQEKREYPAIIHKKSGRPSANSTATSVPLQVAIEQTLQWITLFPLAWAAPMISAIFNRYAFRIIPARELNQLTTVRSAVSCVGYKGSSSRARPLDQPMTAIRDDRDYSDLFGNQEELANE